MRRVGRDLLARPLPAWFDAALVLGTLVGVVWLERMRPLRRRVDDQARHEARNAAMSVLSATAIRLAEKPLTDPLTRLVHRRRWGVVKWLSLPPALEVATAGVLLDYTLYLWHVRTHVVPFLWRFHRVHHADLDLTASTALRFHFAEMVLSVPWRAAQVMLVGAAPLSFSVWQTATLMAILFHHANLRLPLRLERRLCRLVMTPRMHGIHHSIVPEEANSNWSTILAFPDYLHGTCRLDVPQAALTIGVPEFRDADELRLPDLVRLPFGPQRTPWVLPGDGKPRRSPGPALPARALAG